MAVDMERAVAWAEAIIAAMDGDWYHADEVNGARALLRRAAYIETLEADAQRHSRRIRKLEAFVAKVRAARVEESALFDTHYDHDALDQALAELDK